MIMPLSEILRARDEHERSAGQGQADGEAPDKSRNEQRIADGAAGPRLAGSTHGHADGSPSLPPVPEPPSLPDIGVEPARPGGDGSSGFAHGGASAKAVCSGEVDLPAAAPPSNAAQLDQSVEVESTQVMTVRDIAASLNDLPHQTRDAPLGKDTGTSDRNPPARDLDAAPTLDIQGAKSPRRSRLDTQETPSSQPLTQYQVSPSQASTEAAAPTETPGETKRQVLVFFSCKGGSGATLLAINVAHVLARRKQRTCIIDLDLQLGDALAALSLSARLSIAEAGKLAAGPNNIRLDDLSRHASGVHVLSQVGQLDDLDAVTPEIFPPLITEMRRRCDYLVVDGMRDFTDNALAVLDVADRVAIITVQEALGIRRSRWALRILMRIGFRPEDVAIVLNRYSSSAKIRLKDVRDLLSPAPVFQVDNNYALALQSLNEARPLQSLRPQHGLTRGVEGLACEMSGLPPLSTDNGGRGTSLLGRLFGRK